MYSEVQVKYLVLISVGRPLWISPKRELPTPGVPTYNFTKFPRKLHTIEKIWVSRGASLAPPISANENVLQIKTKDSVQMCFFKHQLCLII